MIMNIKMKLNRNSAEEYFKNIKKIEDIEEETIKTLRATESLSMDDRSIKIYEALAATNVNTEIETKKISDMYSNIFDGQGYIKYLAELSINVYTQKDHDLLKDLLKSKGFESNSFDYPKNNPAFRSMIGSDSREGLQEILQQVSDLCGENDIFFELKRTIYNDGAVHYQIKDEPEMVQYIMSQVNSPIIIGSKVDDIINFNIEGEYNFKFTDLFSNLSKLISFEKPEKNTPNEKVGIISGFLNKLMVNAEKSFKDKMVEQNLISLENGFLSYQKDITKLTDITVPFKPAFHKIKDPSIGVLRSYQLEVLRARDLFNEISINGIDNKNESTLKEKNKSLIKKYGF